MYNLHSYTPRKILKNMSTSRGSKKSDGVIYNT